MRARTLVSSLFASMLVGCAPVSVNAPPPRVDVVSRARVHGKVTLDVSAGLLCSPEANVCIAGARSQLESGLQRLSDQVFDGAPDAAAYSATLVVTRFVAVHQKHGWELTLGWRFRMVSRAGATVVDLDRDTTAPTTVHRTMTGAADESSVAFAMQGIEDALITHVAMSLDQLARGTHQ